MDHNKLIAKKAKETLKPLGFVRSGKSRIWFKDNGWWAVLIEFQPSSFSKGTYVNIAVNHFLYESSGWTFHISKRLSPFADAQTDDFESTLESMVSQAAAVAQELQNKFSSVEAFFDYYQSMEQHTIWNSLYIGIFSALLGNTKKAKESFQIICDDVYSMGWELAIQSRAKDLMFVLQDEKAFVNSLHGTILRSRSMMGLETANGNLVKLPE